MRKKKKKKVTTGKAGEINSAQNGSYLYISFIWIQNHVEFN